MCMFSSLPGLFLNSIWLPAQAEDDKPQHPCFVVFRICQLKIEAKQQQCSPLLLSHSYIASFLQKWGMTDLLCAMLLAVDR